MQFNDSMMEEFEMTYLGKLRYFLGFKVRQLEHSVFESQCKYTDDLLNKERMLHCNPLASSMNSNEKLYSSDNYRPTDSTKYSQLIGGLLYSTNTLLDIIHAVTVISHFIQAPSMHYCGAVKKILCYLNGTIGFGIYYTRIEKFKLTGYSDSNQGGSRDDRHSTTSWIFTLGSGAVTQCSKKQPITNLSSIEAEYISITLASYEFVWLHRQLEDLNEKQFGPSVIMCDNKSAISIAHNPVLHGHAKHIDTRYHFIQDLVRDGTIDIVYCSTHDQLTNVFTKGLPNYKFERFRDALCMRGSE